MKVSRHVATEEKRILTGMIVDSSVLGRITEKWEPGGLFRVRWANLVGGWCVRYFQRYGKAPGKHVEGLFEAWAAKAEDDNTISLVDRFLGGLSEDFVEEAEGVNPDYLIDIAGEHFNAVQLEEMAERIKGHIDHGDVDKALADAARWGRVELGTGAGVDVLHDEGAILDAFESNVEPLIKYPGDLGRFFGDQLGRDEFVAITGATGRGKTWWLIDLAWMGLRQARRVAFFEVGDMSQNQIMRRFMCRAAKHPVRPPYDLDIPTSITREAEAPEVSVEFEEKSFSGPLDKPKAWRACQRMTRRHKKPLLRLSVHPNSSISMDGVVGVLDVWEREGWVADVIVIDYADILATPTGYTPGDREAINATWKAMRNLSQSRHTLVVTATQADANSYEAHTIRRSNFSDDRRKNDHVTAMLGINATEGETDMGVTRLNWMKRREQAYSESRCVHVAGCLGIGRPHMKSTF